MPSATPSVEAVLTNPWLVQQLVEMLGGVYGAISLRGTCRTLRALTPAPQRRTARQLMECAVKEGNCQLMEVAHQHGCPWDEKTCADAAKGGQLECLRYAHEQ